MTRMRWMASAVLVLLLAACGGGSSGPAAAPEAVGSVPAQASRSSAALTAWLTTLAGEPNEAGEPLNTAGFEPKRPDDAEPEMLK